MSADFDELWKRYRAGLQEKVDLLTKRIAELEAQIEAVKAVKPFTPTGKGSKWIHVDLLNKALQQERGK
jgi:hypothetical protein